MPRLHAFERTLLCGAALALCVVLCIGERARAQPSDALAIDWEGPPTCPKSERFDAELARRLDPDLALVEPLQVRVQVEALDQSRYQLTLTTQGASGAARRSVDLDDCAELQRAAAVLIATALSPAAARHAPAPTAEALVQPWSLRVAGLFDVSALPRPSGGPSLGLGYERGGLRLWVDARYVVGRESEQVESARVKVDLFAVALGGAYLWRLGPIWVGPQLELELGALRGKAAEAADGSASAPWIAPLAGGVLEADVGPVALLLALALGVPLLRPEFEAQDPGDIYRTRPVTGRAQLGLKIPLGRGDGPKKPEADGQW